MSIRSVMPIICALAMACSACRYDSGGECPADRICTMEFRTIGVQVTDSSGAPVTLDSTHTRDILLNTVVHHSNDPSSFPPYNGHHVVLTDNEMAYTNTQGRDFLFQGFLGGDPVAQGVFRIRHDCCHIGKVSGPEVIVVE